MDTPKLFLSGFVRKDIQYTQALSQTATTVDADVRDFVVDIPISGVVDLGKGLCLPKFRFDQDQDYENARSERIDLQPTTEIVYCQISEMDNELDRLSLPGGPENEATFTTLQEKMVIVTQLLLTFRTIGYGYMSWPEQTPGNLARIIACHILSKYGIEWIIRR